MAVDPSPQHCTGRVGDVSVNGDVMVPAGAACQLIGTTVGGNVSVGAGARLFARSVDVDGDIEGERTGTVEVTEGSEVGGNMQLDSGGTVLVSGSHVDGDLAWEEQQGFLIARDNSVGGNVELDANTGGAELVGNTISGDLSCEENRPTPRGGHNRVSGDEDDQCHDL
jgi:hypothetical protein